VICQVVCCIKKRLARSFFQKISGLITVAKCVTSPKPYKKAQKVGWWWKPAASYGWHKYTSFEGDTVSIDRSGAVSSRPRVPGEVRLHRGQRGGEGEGAGVRDRPRQTQFGAALVNSLTPSVGLFNTINMSS